MADTVTGSVRATLQMTHGSQDGAMALTGVISDAYSRNIATGTGNGQANVIASVSGTVTAGTPVDINLQSLVNAGLPDTITLTKIVTMLIQDVTGSLTVANQLKVGDSTGTLTNAWSSPFSTLTSELVIGSTGALLLDNPGTPYAVDSTHKVLRLKAAAGSITYQVDIVGQQ